jgi:hypothetical protein
MAKLLIRLGTVSNSSRGAAGEKSLEEIRTADSTLTGPPGIAGVGLRILACREQGPVVALAYL